MLVNILVNRSAGHRLCGKGCHHLTTLFARMIDVRASGCIGTAKMVEYIGTRVIGPVLKPSEISRYR